MRPELTENARARGTGMTGLDEPMNETLPIATRPKDAPVKNVRRLKLGANLNQPRHFIGGVLYLLKNPSPIFAWAHDHHSYVVIVRPQLIADIDEGTDKSSGARYGASVQGEVKGLPVRAIDNRDLLGEPNEGLPAVSAFTGVSAQRTTPVAAAISSKTVAERSGDGEERRVDQGARMRDPMGVPKTPIPAQPQVSDSARQERAGNGVPKSLVFGAMI
jgi:hypothetical protein